MRDDLYLHVQMDNCTKHTCAMLCGLRTPFATTATAAVVIIAIINVSLARQPSLAFLFYSRSLPMLAHAHFTRQPRMPFQHLCILSMKIGYKL